MESKSIVKTQSLAQIVLNPNWKPITRIVAAWLIQNARPAQFEVEIGGILQPAKVVKGMYADDIGAQIGISGKSFLAAIEVLHNARIIHRHTKIEPGKNGGHPYKKCSFYIPADGIELRATGDSKNTITARKTIARKQEKMDALLASLKCPSCGEIGCLHSRIEAVCDSCKIVVGASELDELIEAQKVEAKSSKKAARLARPAKAAHRNLNLQTVKNGLSDPEGDLSEENFSLLSDERKTFPYYRQDMSTKNESSSLSAPTQNDSTIPHEVQSSEVLTGSKTLDYFDRLIEPDYRRQEVRGDNKCFAYDYTKAGTQIPESNYVSLDGAKAWLETPRSMICIEAPARQDSFKLLDFDLGFDEAKQHRLLKNRPEIFRENADSGKVFVLVSGKVKDMTKVSGNGIELEIKSSGNVAGIGPSGAPYKARTGSNNSPLTQADLRQIVLDLFGVDYLATPEITESTSQPAKADPDKKLVYNACQWIQQKGSPLKIYEWAEGQIDALTDNGAKAGFKTHEEHTPSTYRTDGRGKDAGRYHKVTTTNYATDERKDGLQMWLEDKGLTGPKKRDYILNVIVPLYQEHLNNPDAIQIVTQPGSVQSVEASAATPIQPTKKPVWMMLDPQPRGGAY